MIADQTMPGEVSDEHGTVHVSLDEALDNYYVISTFLTVSNALLNLSGRSGRRWVSVQDLKNVLPLLSVDTISAELGSLHDWGKATVIGAVGPDRRARWDGDIT